MYHSACTSDNPLKYNGHESLNVGQFDSILLLQQLTKLPRQELLERASIRDRKNALFIPSECLIYFIRASRFDNSDRWFEALYKILSERVLRALPRSEGLNGTLSLSKDSVRHAVYDRFVALLAADRQLADDKLDFFEIRFDLALKRLRLDAQEKVWLEAGRTEALGDDEMEDSLPQQQTGPKTYSPFEDDIFLNPTFRERVYAAIDKLPLEQSRTIHLLLLGWPTDSKDPTVMTIAKALGCTDRSVRNYRDRVVNPHFQVQRLSCSLVVVAA